MKNIVARKRVKQRTHKRIQLKYQEPENPDTYIKKSNPVPLGPAAVARLRFHTHISHNKLLLPFKTARNLLYPGRTGLERV